MKRDTDDLSVLERLNLALETEALPAGAREHATHLIRRLSSPVRVACLGLSKSGKSQLINMFVGHRLIPTDRVLPTLEVVWADAPHVKITQADGSVVDAGIDQLASADLAQAAFLRIGFPSEILKRISLLEVTPEGAMSEQRAAIDWAIRRTDIALWCSQSFGPSEKDLWSRVPDSLKDHAFLVLTKADILGAEGKLGGLIAALDGVVAEEFHSLFPVATLHALAAIRSDGTVDDAKRLASGGGGLTVEVLKHADRGRRADMDSAYLFLSRYQVRSDPRKAAEARTPSRPSPLEDVDPVVEPIVQPVADAPQPTAEPAAEMPANVTLFADGVRFLRRRGAGLVETAASLGPGNAKPLIDQCVDTVEHLVDLFSQDETDDPVTDAFIDELAEAAEIMVLMQLEDGDAPAADAVTLLLQLRRDMELKLAA